jgi:hypothetical protein
MSREGPTYPRAQLLAPWRAVLFCQQFQVDRKMEIPSNYLYQETRLPNDGILEWNFGRTCLGETKVFVFPSQFQIVTVAFWPRRTV